MQLINAENLILATVTMYGDVPCKPHSSVYEQNVNAVAIVPSKQTSIRILSAFA